MPTVISFNFNSNCLNSSRVEQNVEIIATVNYCSSSQQPKPVIVPETSEIDQRSASPISNALSHSGIIEKKNSSAEVHAVHKAAEVTVNLILGKENDIKMIRGFQIPSLDDQTVEMEWSYLNTSSVIIKKK